MENVAPSVIQSAIKFTSDEMKELIDIRNGFDQASVAFGKVVLQKKNLEKTEKQLDIEYELLVKQDKDFLDMIVKKYGEGSYDPNTGIFTPAKKS